MGPCTAAGSGAAAAGSDAAPTQKQQLQQLGCQALGTALPRKSWVQAIAALPRQSRQLHLDQSRSFKSYLYPQVDVTQLSSAWQQLTGTCLLAPGGNIAICLYVYALGVVSLVFTLSIGLMQVRGLCVGVWGCGNIAICLHVYALRAVSVVLTRTIGLRR